MFNRPLRPPSLHEDLPLYPPLSQLVRVTSTRVAGPSGSTGSSSAGVGITFPYLYLGATQQATSEDDPVVGIHALIPRDREPCLVHDVVGDGLDEGYHLGRLTGSFGGLPIYTVVQRASTASTPLLSGCRADTDGSISVVNAGFTDATLTVTGGSRFCYDNGGYFNASQPTRLTAPEDGVYRADFFTGWTDKTGFYGATILVNTSEQLGASWLTFDQSIPVTITVVRFPGLGVGKLLAGDYVRLRATQSASSGATTRSFTGWLSLNKIGDIE